MPVSGGRLCHEVGLASAFFPHPASVAHPRAGGWPEDFLSAIGLQGITARFPAEMPALGDPIGPLSAAAAAETGLPADVLVVAGGTDAYVAMVGLNTLRPRRH